MPASFVPRWDAAVSFLPASGKVVLFGGSPNKPTETWQNDTWIHANGKWTKGPVAPAGLTPRGRPAMAYLPEIGKIVLFGGANGAWPPALADTWLFDGTAWTLGPAAPAGLTPRAGAGMVYDPDIHKLVMVGGTGLGSYNDTWLFDGTAWTPGPPAPAGMLPRSSFGMAYDPSMRKVVVAGGSGATDVWYFDGSAWSAGPSIAAMGPRERVRMDFDPQLGGIVMVGGIGPGFVTSDMWLLRAGAWTKVTLGTPWPPARLDGAVLWHPNTGALMVVGGVRDLGLDGSVGLADSWFFNEVAPQVASVTLSPTQPTENQSVTLSTGATTGGYGKLTTRYSWYVNGAVVEGVGTRSLGPQYIRPMDTVQAKAQITDSLGIVGPDVASAVITVADRAPALGQVSISPNPGFILTPLVAAVTNVRDPDGDPVTLRYAWTIDGLAAGTDSPILPPLGFHAGAAISLTVTPVDSWGMAGPVGIATDSIVGGLTGTNPRPGGQIYVSGTGFLPLEGVDIRLDSTSGTLIGTVNADLLGAFQATSFIFPSPVAGGPHTLYGKGKLSGIVGTGPITVVPGGSILPSYLPSGGSTTFTGLGFVPGEIVSASFPGGAVVQGPADSTGTVSLQPASPPEPWPSGTLTASAPSGTLAVGYTVISKLSGPTAGAPLSPATFSATGYGASETVNVSFDGGPVAGAFVTDPKGSGSLTLTLPSTFGTHTVAVKGATTGQSVSASIAMKATMTVTPASGPVGTVVTIDSGPGWVPGSTVHVEWGYGNIVKDLVADAGGKVHTTYAIPNTVPGKFNLWLVDTVLGQSAYAPFEVK